MVQALYLDSGPTETVQGSRERLRDSHCHHMKHQSEAKETKKVQISTGRVNPTDFRDSAGVLTPQLQQGLISFLTYWMLFPKVGREHED